MAQQTTLKTLLEDVAARSGLGIPLKTITATASTVTAANANLEGPFSANRIPRGSPIVSTQASSGATGTVSYIDTYNPATGVLNLNPANFTGNETAAVLFYGRDVPHTDRVIEAINRALTLRCARRQRIPMTWVTDGDMLAAGTTAWTLTAGGTLSKQVEPFPGVWTQYVLQLAGANANDAVQSTAFNVTLNPAATVQTRYFLTAIKVVSGTGNAILEIVDVTHGTVITPQLRTGSPTYTMTSAALDWTLMSGTFQIPANCNQIAYRLRVDAGSTTAQLAPVMDFPIHATVFPLQSRVLRQRVGNFYYGSPTVTPGGLYDMLFSSQTMVDGREVKLIDTGDHLSVQTNFLPIRPYYYDELIYDPPLVNMTDVTTFPAEYVERWAIAELYNWMEEAEPVAFDNYGRPRSTRWAPKVLAALTSAKSVERIYGVQPETVYRTLAENA